MKRYVVLFEKMFLIFFVFSCLGWIYEVLLYLIRDNEFVNRGFLVGPYLPIYGFGALILYYLLWNFIKKKHKIGKVNINIILVFVIIFIVTTFVEYVSHYFLDTYFGIILWDYSDDFLNINGRVCFEASRNFAIGGTFSLYCIQPLIERFVTKFNNKKFYHIIIGILFLIMIADFLIKIF